MPTDEQQTQKKRRQQTRHHLRQQHGGSGSSGSGTSSRSSGGGSLWRQLFSCTDPMTEDDLAQTQPAGKPGRSNARRHGGRSRRHQATIEEATTEEEDDEDEEENDEDTATAEPRRRQKQQSRPQKQKKRQLTPDDCYSQSKDSFWQKLFRNGDGSTHDGSSVTIARSQQQQRAKSPYVGNRRRHKKRLVLAMLEDDDGATNTMEPQAGKAVDSGVVAASAATSASATGDGGLQIRATRDETNIRRILQSLSDSLKPQLPMAASVETSAPTQAAQEMHQQTQLSQQPTSASIPSSSLSLPQPPSSSQQQQQQQQQQPQPPKPSAPQPQSQQQQSNTYLRPKSPPQPQTNLQRPTPPPTRTTEPSSRTRRHGYRIFHRVCSAAENYYAVPFPPLETLKFKEDDDGQWEDQEVYVASHKGLFALKPKQKSSQTRSEKLRLMKGVGRLGVTAGRQLPQQPQQSQRQQRNQKQKKQQSSGRPQAGDCGKQRIGHQQQGNNRLDKQQQQTLQCGRQNRPNQPQQQQQKFQRMPTKLPVLSNKRAEPLNAGRLLHQLNSDEVGPDPRDAAPVGSMDSGGTGVARTSGAVPSYMRPYSPLQRAKWTAAGGTGGGGEGPSESGVAAAGRCGRLTSTVT